MATIKSITFKIKTGVAPFWATFDNFYSNIWSHWPFQQLLLVHIILSLSLSPLSHPIHFTNVLMIPLGGQWDQIGRFIGVWATF